ncbi:WbuC family cupin fold metalloprotein [Rhodohalobacter mucosus]|uniref:Cupin fold metalloprotein, WbuC family n=1 Tax=Rhodohalobacter mucosus TaxID=2079485 RepID=A0A316TQ75_9BACT|nr:WbuC family cupin fold metalloprotein [Rhodohalobacter mucosus]PWN05369.1 cupin fold metalloprotein, WbuC family [Rhodohalobacter mucosus]
MKQAFENPSGDVFFLEEKQMEEGLQASRRSDRLRIILPLHREQDAEVQRLINFLQPGTYIRPHMHPMPHATESIVVLRGKIRFFTFNDSGSPQTDRIISFAPFPGITDIEPGIWHSFLVLEKDTVLFECKKGPYDADTDKVFASWAPAEGSLEAAEWLSKKGKYP